MSDATRISYQDIKVKVLQSIRDNTWPPGTIMPGEVELAERFGCARATVNRAMRELAEEGILDRKRKAGTRVKKSPTRQAKFVIPVIRDEVENTGGTYRYALVTRTQMPAPSWLCAKLQLLPEDQVLHLHCMHYSDNKPYQYEDRWINLSAAPGALDTDFKSIGPNEWLVREIPFTDAELTFSASRASRDVAEFLDSAEGDALFTIERTTWLNKQTVTFARLHFSPGYQLTTKL